MAPHHHPHHHVPQALAPKASLLRLSAAWRMAGAAGLALVLWALVFWALQP